MLFCVVGGKQQFSFLDVRDAAEAILRLVECDVGEWEVAYNLARNGRRIYWRWQTSSVKKSELIREM